MKTIHSVALAGALALGLVSTAQAQSLAPTVPSPSNPTPLNPVATNGSPLPYRGAGDQGGLVTGRSAFAPAGGFIGLADTAVGTGLGVAGGVVDGGLGVARDVVR